MQWMAILRNLNKNIFQCICNGTFYHLNGMLIGNIPKGRSRKAQLYSGYLGNSTSPGRHLSFSSSSTQEERWAQRMLNILPKVIELVRGRVRIQPKMRPHSACASQKPHSDSRQTFCIWKKRSFGCCHQWVGCRSSFPVHLISLLKLSFKEWVICWIPLSPCSQWEWNCSRHPAPSSQHSVLWCLQPWSLRCCYSTIHTK